MLRVVNLGRHHLIRTSRQSREENCNVVRFQRRAKSDGSARRRGPIEKDDLNVGLVLSLAKYERVAQEDDYRHRTIVNGLAFLVTVALIAMGVWLAANLYGY
jgi:hypothetical protein